MSRFERELNDALIGEWKQSYLDYNALKSSARISNLNSDERKPLLRDSGHTEFANLIQSEIERISDFYEEAFRNVEQHVAELHNQLEQLGKAREVARRDGRPDFWRSTRQKLRRLVRTGPLLNDLETAESDLRLTAFTTLRKARLLWQFAESNAQGFYDV